VKTLFLFTLALMPVLSWAGAGITYHGRLIDPNGVPVVSNSVQFKLQIRTPGNENCLMYEEVQVKDLSQASGAFAVTINDGTGTRLDVTGYSLDQIFANRNSFTFAGGNCASGSTYAPNASDSRKIQVLFNDGTFAVGLWEPVPPMAINFVPMAIESMQVGGYKKEQLLKIADGVGTTGTELNAAAWTELQALIAGSSTQFIKPGNATFTAAPVWSGTPSTADDLTNKSYVDAQVAAALPNVGTAGTYTKVTTDAKGRVIVGLSLIEADLPNITTAGKVDGGAINAGTISGTAAINTSGNLYTTGTVTGATVSATNLRVYNGANYVQFTAPALGGSDVLFKLPAADGTTGQVLKTDGSGNLGWASGAALPGLASTFVWVGSGTGVATAVALSGDVASVSNAGAVVIDKTTTGQSSKILSLDGSGIANAFGFGVQGSTSGTVTLGAQAISANYTLRYPAVAPAANQVLESDASGNFTWINKSSITDASKLPLTGGTMAGDIDMNGNDINNVYLASSAILVGNASNRMAPMAMAGDMTIANNGVTTIGVDKITTGKILDATILAADMDFTGVVNVNSGFVMKDSTGKFNNFLCATAGHVPAWTVTGWVCQATSLSGLTGATAFNSIDNLNFGQVWNWSTATTQHPMIITANALTTGSLLKLTTSSAAVNSNNGLLNVANTSASVDGILARFQANSAFNSGMTLLNSGRVGIGVVSPDRKLHVLESVGSGTLRTVVEIGAEETVAGTGVALDFSQGGTVTGKITNIYESGSHIGMGFSTYLLGTTSEKMRISAEGNVGIGTSGPVHPLVVHGVSADQVPIIDVVATSTATYGRGVRILGAGMTAGQDLYYSVGRTEDFNNSGQFGFRYVADGSNSNMMTIGLFGQPAGTFVVTGGGNVGIGTTNPTAKLDVKGHFGNSGDAAFVGTCGTSPVISGNDMRGVVTLGTGSPTACTVTFALAYDSTPVCVITPVGGNPGAIQWWVVPSTTALVMNFSASPTASQQFAYHCVQ
jgi:hypothetical protein